MKSCIVKRKFTPKALLPSIVSIFIGVAAAVLLLKVLYLLSLIAFVAGLFVALFLAQGNIFSEYEYNIEGETFSVALIRNKASRKELFSCDVAHLTICEPYAKQHFVGEKLDFSENVNSLYFASFSEEGKTASLLFSPDEAFVRELFLLAPSRVKRSIM